jgi:hypothetical protein
MYLSPDDARSDVILTGAATVFGGVLLSLLLAAPGIPTTGLGGEIVLLLGWFALSGLTPFLLARYRDDVPGAFGLAPGRATPTGAALLLAAPVVVLGVLRGLLVDGSLATALLGRVGVPLLGSPVVGPAGVDVVGVVLEVLGIAVLTIGALLLIGFLVVRGRDAFRNDDRSSTELLRTFGAGAAGVALLLGGLRSLGSGGFVTVLLNVLALGAIVLIADRLIPPHAEVTRPAVLTPVALMVVAHVLSAGGIFRGDLLLGLSRGALAAGTVLVIAVVAEHHRTTAVVVPLLLAVHWWPTCLSPLPFVGC